ncbi:hypothetical protein ACJX0J_038254, partial [Zea mays]
KHLNMETLCTNFRRHVTFDDSIYGHRTLACYLRRHNFITYQVQYHSQYKQASGQKTSLL